MTTHPTTPNQPRLLLASAAALFLAGCGTAQNDATAQTRETWSNPTCSAVETKFPKVHGTFGAEPVSVSATGLPAHKMVTLKFKLILLGAWDGSNMSWGPDFWGCRVRGGEQLVFATFSNMGAESPYYIQSYPDDFAKGTHYAFTGATPVRDKPFAKPGCSGSAIAPACYPMEMTFPHTGDTLTVDFTPFFDDGATDYQRWAIADFEYGTAAEPVKLAAGELESLWETLAAPDSIKANAAMWRLISAGEPAADFLVKKAGQQESCDTDLSNKPEGLRVHRMIRALRILNTPAAGTAVFQTTFQTPEFGNPPTPAAP